jgi:hypothetical protein
VDAANLHLQTPNAFTFLGAKVSSSSP